MNMHRSLQAVDSNFMGTVTGPKPQKPTWDLPLVDATRWIGNLPPRREWIVDGWLARGTGALLVGEDGVGKSLIAQQLASCVATGRPFLGMPTMQAPALYVSCEDDEIELWRRQRAVNEAIGVPTDAAPAMLSSLVGYTDVILGAFDPDGSFDVSPAFEGIARAAKERGAGLIVLDNVAHLFAGNENVRREVAAFCSALDRLAIDCNATVMVLAHPNKGGAEYSGSTGWSAHVRQRWFMERPEDNPDRDARVLRKSKANYSEAGTEIAFRWRDWAFVADTELPDSDRAQLRDVAQAANENAAFLHCLEACTKAKRAVSHNPGVNYAPAVFAKMAERKGHKRKAFEHAFERLLHLGDIEIDKQLWQAENRHFKYGIRASEKCANPPAPTPCADLRHAPSQVIENTCADLRAPTPLYINISGRGHEGPPPTEYDPDDIAWDADTEAAE